MEVNKSEMTGLKKMIVQYIFLLLGISPLLYTSAYLSPYILITILAAFSIWLNSKPEKASVENILGYDKKLLLVFSAFLALCVFLAEYSAWLFEPAIYKVSVGMAILNSVIAGTEMYAGLFVAFYNILLLLANYRNRIIWPAVIQKKFGKNVFIISFSVFFIIYFFVFLQCQYPANLSPDSVDQLTQIVTGKYSNHHPFYHTMLIKVWYELGMMICNDVNNAVALYSIFSIVIMAVTFAYAMQTAAETGAPLKALVIMGLFYSLMPYHIIYSFTVWKDVLFAGAVFAFVVSMYRVCQKIGTQVLNYTIFVISGIGVCLLRSNGMFSYLLVFLCASMMLIKTEKNMILVMLAVLLFSYLMKHPMLDAMQIKQPSIAEALSIPEQQIARVIVEKNDLTETEEYWLKMAIPVDAVPDLYLNYISDPVKAKVNGKIISNNKMQFLKIYLSIGSRHPITYVKAWIDQTKGYWNGGYSYWVWCNNIVENKLGIERIVRSRKIEKAFSTYLHLYETNPVLQLFLSIGLNIWIHIVAFFLAAIRKDKLGMLLCIPVLAITISLIISTPVFSEFRYIYSAFCTIPFVIHATMSVRYNNDSITVKRSKEC